MQRAAQFDVDVEHSGGASTAQRSSWTLCSTALPLRAIAAPLAIAITHSRLANLAAQAGPAPHAVDLLGASRAPLEPATDS